MDVAQRRKKYGKREMHSQIVSFQPVSIKRSCKNGITTAMLHAAVMPLEP